MLGRTLGRLQAFDHDGVERGFEQFEVGYVRSAYHHRKRSSVCLNQKGTLHSVFASVGGIGAHEVPPKRAFPYVAPYCVPCGVILVSKGRGLRVASYSSSVAPRHQHVAPSDVAIFPIP